jgi:hypothetical protein
MTRSSTPTKTTGRTMTTAQTPRRLQLPDGSRSVQSVWVWRGFLFMSLVALGLCIRFALGGLTFFAVAWAVITVGWAGIAVWLWRKHVHEDDLAWRASQRGRRTT